MYSKGAQVLTVEDLQHREREQQEEEIRGWIAAEKQRGFD